MIGVTWPWPTKDVTAGVSSVGCEDPWERFKCSKGCQTRVSAVTYEGEGDGVFTLSVQGFDRARKLGAFYGAATGRRKRGRPEP